MKEVRYRIRVFAIIIALAVSGSIFLNYYQDDDTDFEVSKNLDIYYSLFKELSIYYVDETDPGKLIKTSIDEMLKSLDPYTVYIPESEMEDFKFMTTGQYGGIGALIRKSGDYIVITDPYENFPAFKGGLKAGDVIMAIDGKSIKGKKSDDVSELLKGQPNTEIKLTIKRPGTEDEFVKTLTREEIKLESVPYYSMLTPEIGYIRLRSFTQNCGNDVKKAFLELKEKNDLKKLVLDLRGNPGGLLIEAVNITNLFVEKGNEIVSTKGKVKQWDKTYRASQEPIDTQMPIVVLVNRSSASASEIVAGAIQDLDRGVIVGQRTFGKGLVQTTRPLSYNAKLKVTTAKYYIPSGRCIQALDYSHRNEDGSVGKVPDSLITEFKTKSGRKVFDGGGILPDVQMDAVKMSNIAYSLASKNLIFDFATEYVLKNKEISDSKSFTLSDNDYDGFVKYLSGKEFDYKTESESILKDLVKKAKDEKYYDLATDEFTKLQEKLAHDKDKDLRTFKSEIIELIDEEIAGRYFYQRGRIEAQIENDPEIKKAVEVLGDMNNYYSLLKPSTEKK
ncbi:MAG: peptidase S41 [Bacteroidetes bacterium GWF2_38_335]|nr:MAG: peptidase S41 [Bacteroidetes bacterium GWF2_38_335]OFY77239.1 MAG: peptidase S41 [Bacteroidetes bacterium RIFOXYA12_FULL_38_20]HBS85759.1 peptidase S41 [Bacteroidales bacterium]